MGSAVVRHPSLFNRIINSRNAAQNINAMGNLLTLVDITRKTASGYRISRKCEHDIAIGYCDVGNILTYTLENKQADINSAVLEMMTMAAQDVLDLSKPLFKGDFTARELAGRVANCIDPVELFANPDYVNYKRIYIECGTFKCFYETNEVFLMLSEWEGMMSIPQNKAHRFPCEAEKEKEKDVELKPYKCSRGYRPRRVAIYDADEERIAKKYKVLGPLSKSLTEEGMKKAFSVAAVLYGLEKQYDLYDIAKVVLSKKLHNDYGVKDTDAVQFCGKDFEYAPDCWLQVDDAYVEELRDYLSNMYAESPAPDWMKVGDFVQLKNQKLAPKKWQGKLKVCAITPNIDYRYANRICWYVEVSTTKGKWDSMTRTADWFVGYSESPTSVPSPGRGEKRAKAPSLQNENADIRNDVTEAKPTFAELLRNVLMAA